MNLSTREFMQAIVCFLVLSILGHTSQAVEKSAFFRPETANYWAGSLERHKLDPQLAVRTGFPPIFWDSGEFESGEAWYEFEVPDEMVPDGLGAVMITRLYLTADLYLNRHLVGSGGSMTPPLAKNAHRPLYFTIPASAWNATGNKIQVQHKSYPNTGYLLELLVAPDEQLRPIYNARIVRQQTIPKILFICEILAGVLVFFIWLARRDKTTYLWFSLSILMLSLFTLNQFLIDTYVSHKIWHTLIHASVDWWVIFLSLFVYRKVGINNRKVEMALLGYGGIALIYYTALPLERMPVTILFHGVGFMVIIVNAAYLLYQRMKNGLPSFAYALFFMALALIATHDLLMQSIVWPERWRDGYFILFYAAPLSGLLIAGQIIREFISAMRETEHHAENLQKHIERTRTELEKQYRLLQEAVKEQAVANERNRIYQDLHDDVGAKLLSLYYRAEDAHIGTLAKTALEDLRDIVSRKSMQGEQLSHAADYWQDECSARAQEHGVDLVWRCDIAGDRDVHLNETQYTHITRMLREATSNALRHAEYVQRISVDIRLDKRQLRFKLVNDGIATQVSEWRHGRGLNNIFIRARELGGNAKIYDLSTNNVCVSWTIPVD